MILGLDASTAVIGWTILTNKGKVKSSGYIDLRSTKDMYDKLSILNESLLPLIKKCDSVYMEAPLQRSNNQMVVNLLQRWNGMICAWAFSSGRRISLITQSNAHKAIDLKVPKGIKGRQRKEYIAEQQPEVKKEYKRTGSLKDYCYDMADACVIAKAGFALYHSS